MAPFTLTAYRFKSSFLSIWEAICGWAQCFCTAWYCASLSREDSKHLLNVFNVRDDAKHIAFIITLNLHNSPDVQTVIPIFTDTKTEAQTGWLAQDHTASEVTEMGLRLSYHASRYCGTLHAYPVVLKVRFLGQQPQHFLGTCQKCTFSVPFQACWIRNSGDLPSNLF